VRTGIIPLSTGLLLPNELILLDNRGIGRSIDNGQPFDIAKLADDAARVTEMLGIERVDVLG
jgi:pimeloyl-ACP methyl ester carboxylesterase